MPDFIRVVNKEDRPFSFHHNNTKKKIKPLGETMMPWDLACTLFGDPFAIDSPKKPDRKDSLARARSNFNYEMGMESMAAFDARRPSLECYDMETGQRIYMLIDDAEGEHAPDFIHPDAEPTDQIGLLQRQLNAVTEQLSILISQKMGDQPDAPVGQTVTASTDGPSPDVVTAPGGKAEWVDGQPFAQRPEDVTTEALFDFTALSVGDIDSPPDATTDEPQDAGVGSGHDDAPSKPASGKGSAKLAPKPA